MLLALHDWSIICGSSPSVDMTPQWHWLSSRMAWSRGCELIPSRAGMCLVGMMLLSAMQGTKSSGIVMNQCRASMQLFTAQYFIRVIY